MEDLIQIQNRDWNVEPLKNKVQENMKVSKHHKTDICVVQEAKMKQKQNCRNMKIMYKLYRGVDKEQRARKRVNIFMHNRYIDTTGEYNYVSDVFLLVKLEVK